MKKSKVLVGLLAVSLLSFLPGNVSADNITNLSVTEQVRNVTQNGPFAKYISARGGDVLEYEIRVRNTGAFPVTNMAVTSATTGGQYTGAKTGYYSNKSYNGSLDTNSSITVSLLEVGGELVIKYSTLVSNYNSASQVNFCATSSASASNAQVTTSDTACVTLNPNIIATSIGLTYALSATNDTKNSNATLVTAGREDYITFKLSVTNNGSQPASGYVISNDLSGVLPLADLVDNGGGTLVGQVLNFLPVTIDPGATVVKTIRVRVKYFLPNIAYVMLNTFGNTVQINIDQGKVLGASTVKYVAPRVGANTNLPYAVGFGAFLALGSFVLRKGTLKQLLG